MSIAAHETRDQKFNWLLKPIDMAFSTSFFGSLFGFVYFAFGITDNRIIICGLVAALGITAGLLFWARLRMSQAAGKL